jgi:CBS domain-containing protein
MWVVSNFLKKGECMLARECMTKQVELGTPTMTLQEAAIKMRDGDFGALPINENDRLVGMVTDRDIVIRAVAEGKDLSRTTVREILSPNILYCFEDETLEDIAANLGENQVRRLPVLNRQKRLVGILSLGDLAQSHADANALEESLDRISQHSVSASRHSEMRM